MGMRTKRTKNKRTFTYTGDLQISIEEAEKELKKKTSSQERVFLLWQFERAKKAYERYEQRIADLIDFIGLGKEELKNQTETEETTR